MKMVTLITFKSLFGLLATKLGIIMLYFVFNKYQNWTISTPILHYPTSPIGGVASLGSARSLLIRHVLNGFGGTLTPWPTLLSLRFVDKETERMSCNVAGHARTAGYCKSRRLCSRLMPRPGQGRCCCHGSAHFPHVSPPGARPVQFCTVQASTGQVGQYRTVVGQASRLVQD